MSSPDVRAMLFDLDGTLLDSAPDLVAALNHVRVTEGLKALPLAQMSPHASHGAMGLLKAGMPETDAATLEVWRLRFLAHYGVNSFVHSSLYDGVSEVVRGLNERKIPWGVVTNKFEYLTYPILEATGLGETISCVVCGDTIGEKKPHPAPVTLACSLLDVAPEHVVFAGDDVRDIESGRAAGTQTAAIHYGYGSHALTGHAIVGSFRIHHPSDLMGLLG